MLMLFVSGDPRRKLLEHFFTLIISSPRFNTTVPSCFLFHTPDIPLDLYWACIRSLLVTPSG